MGYPTPWNFSRNERAMFLFSPLLRCYCFSHLVGAPERASRKSDNWRHVAGLGATIFLEQSSSYLERNLIVCASDCASDCVPPTVPPTAALYKFYPSPQTGCVGDTGLNCVPPPFFFCPLDVLVLWLLLRRRSPLHCPSVKPDSHHLMLIW